MSLLRQKREANKTIAFDGQIRPASWPTRARPGSPRKIAVLRWRYEHGEELFHPQDVTLFEGRQVGACGP